MEDYNQKSWLSRNWPWALPLGCCSGCLVTILFMFFGTGIAIFSMFNEMSELSPTQEIISIAKNNPKVIELIGEDIETNFLPNGNFSIQNGDGELDFYIGVYGSKGEGTLYVKGIRANEKWIFEDLYIINKETEEHINLLNGF